MSFVLFPRHRVLHWLDTTFGEHGRDPEERALRFQEEVTELTQTEGITREQQHALVDQVYDKPVGDPQQEWGGVMFTLAAYALVKEQDLGKSLWKELDEVEKPEVAAKIAAKHKTKAVVSSRFRGIE